MFLHGDEKLLARPKPFTSVDIFCSSLAAELQAASHSPSLSSTTEPATPLRRYSLHLQRPQPEHRTLLADLRLQSPTHSPPDGVQTQLMESEQTHRSDTVSGQLSHQTFRIRGQESPWTKFSPVGSSQNHLVENGIKRLSTARARRHFHDSPTYPRRSDSDRHEL